MASIKIGNVTYGAEELSKTFQTYRKEFVIMPFLAMEQLAKHMNVRTGIRYRETVSQMSTDAEISNYSKTKHQDADVKIDPRVFETFFGNIVQGIDPNAIYQSIWVATSPRATVSRMFRLLCRCAVISSRRLVRKCL